MTDRSARQAEMSETTLQNIQPVPVVIVSRPGMMQQSLSTSLAACPWVFVVASFGDGLSTLSHLAQFHPAILVIDSNLLDEEVDALLAAVKDRQPDIRCLVLVRSSLRAKHLVTYDADAVVARNGSAQELHQALIRLARDTAGQRT